MAIVKPFRGLRPPKNLVERVEARPYDVLDSEEARREAFGNEMSLYHITRPEINFLPERRSMILAFMRVQLSSFKNFKKKGGWCRMRKPTIIFMHRL